MGVLLAFFLGWATGAQAGAKGFREVVDAVRTVKESEEFEALVAISRAHLSNAMHEVGKLVSGETPAPNAVQLLERVQKMTSHRST